MVRDHHINIFYSAEDQGSIADTPDLDARSAFGDTSEQALRAVQESKAQWLEAARAAGKPIPAARYCPVFYQAAGT